MVYLRKSPSEVAVAKLYLLLLPFRMIAPLEFLQDLMGPLANYIDTIFISIGLFLWIMHQQGIHISKINMPLYKTVRNSILYLNASSIVMACVMYCIYGDCNGKSPFVGIIPMILFYTQYFFMFLYNIRVFQLLTYNDIVKLISKCCLMLLVLGYAQVLAMLGVASSVYDVFAEILSIPTSDYPKLSLTGSEGASAGVLLGVFIFPFLFARYIHGDKKSLTQVFLWLVPLYFTHSSTAYMLFGIDLMLFIYVYIKKLNSSATYIKIISIGCISISLYIGATYMGVINNKLVEEINYMAFEKVGDKSNGSTMARMAPYFINWGCFTEMPIMGVGNGLQGYFFKKYFPYRLLSVPGTDLGQFYKRATEDGKIANGGCFLPGYFSGYGIIGIIVLVNIIIQLRKTRNTRRKELGVFNEMFTLGAVAFFVMAFTSEVYCLYYAWFVLSIPFMYYKNAK